MNTYIQIHKAGSFPCPWSHLPPDAEFLATSPLFLKKTPWWAQVLLRYITIPFPVWSSGVFPTGGRPLILRGGCDNYGVNPPADIHTGGLEQHAVGSGLKYST